MEGLVRRSVLIGVLAIGAVFLASVAILDRLDGSDSSSAPPLASDGPPGRAPEPTAVPAPPVVKAPTPSPEVVRQLASPPVEPAPTPPPDPLPPSGAPPAPVYVRQAMGSLEAMIVSRCGKMTLRLGDQLRKEGRGPGTHAVFLLDVEPLDGEAKIWGTTLQSPGSTRPALVACAQHTLRGHLIPVGSLQPGGRVKVQVVLGMLE